MAIDNILQPHRPYYGEEKHKISQQDQHKILKTVANNIEKRQKQNKNDFPWLRAWAQEAI